MKKNRTRPIAALLTVVMLLTALPAPAFALLTDDDVEDLLPDDNAGNMLPDDDIVELPERDDGSDEEQPSPPDPIYDADDEALPEQDDSEAAILTGAQANASLSDLIYDAGVEGASVSLKDVGGTYYLFLPSSADLSEMVLLFAGDPVTLTAGRQSITITSGHAFDLTALYASAPTDGVYSIVLSRGSSQLSVKVMASANIASMFITSDNPASKGRTYVEAVKGNKATGQMTLLGVTGESVYVGELTQIKGRGNSTWNYPKKPYQIKLSRKTDLLETGAPGKAAKTWILLANYYDTAFIRDSLTYDLAAELGLPYSPRSRPVDLYYDGEYRGTYLLCEKVEIGSARIDIHDLEEDFEDANPNVEDFDKLPTAKDRNAYGNVYQYVTGLTNPPDISGGYLLEMDFDERAVVEKSWFTTSQNYYIVSKSPEYLSQDAIEYISAFYQEFEDAVWNGGVHPTTGKSYTDYVDLESLARCYAIGELSQDGDTYRSSAFFYKPIGEDKLYCGPVWDFDSAYGKYRFIYSDTYLVANKTSFALKLLTIPSFCEAVQDVYRNELHTLVTDVLLSTDAGAQTGRLRSLPGYQAEVAASLRMNNVLWSRSGSQGLTASVNELRDFITRRDVLLNGLQWAGVVSALAFSDISPDDWYVSPVAYVVDKGLLSGTSASLFSPKAIMTRAMTVTVLHRLAGTPDAEGDLAFDDVPSDQWYAKAVAWAAETGIVGGYPDGLFHPDDEITRQELAVILYLYYTGNLGGDGDAPALPDRFTDRSRVADWALEAMSWVVDRGILSGTSNTELSPTGYTERCMAASMLQRYCGLIETASADPVDPVDPADSVDPADP